MSTTQVPALNMDKLNTFIGQFVTDLGAAVHAGMVVIGEKLGLYKALSERPMTSAELAVKTQTDERYLREWLCIASRRRLRYVRRRSPIKFSLDQEQAFTLATKTVRRICRVHLNWRWARWLRFRALRSLSAPAPGWVGTNTLTACSTDAKNSSAPATPPTW